MSDAHLIIGGDVWKGWEGVTITSSIEQASNTFKLKLTDQWPGSGGTRPIAPGVACHVEVGGTAVVTGFIDDATEEFAADRHELTVRGRDAAGDLVDCSAIHKSGEWKNAKLEEIAADLCKPFNITVTARTSTGKAFESFRIQEGETVFETIERACRQRALLVKSDGVGGLVIVSGKGVENSNGALKLGENGNVLNLRAEASVRERFSKYTVKGQNIGAGFMEAEEIAGDEASVQDGTVTRHRPLIVLAEEPGDGPTFEERARWEQRVRAGRAKRMTATVQGWLDWMKQPWRPGDLVPCDFPRYTGDMLITQVQFTKGENGTTSAIELAAPGALDVLAEVEQDGGLGW